MSFSAVCFCLQTVYLYFCLLYRNCKAKLIYFFSATFERNVNKFVEEFMGKPKYTISEGDKYHVENLLQYYVVAKPQPGFDVQHVKLDILSKIYLYFNEGQSLLYCDAGIF